MAPTIAAGVNQSAYWYCTERDTYLERLASWTINESHTKRALDSFSKSIVESAYESVNADTTHHINSTRPCLVAVTIAISFVIGVDQFRHQS